MAADEQEHRRKWDAESAAARDREAFDAALDDVSAYPPTLVVKVACRIIAELALHELVQIGDDEFDEALQDVAATLGVPYVELTMAAHANVNNPEVRRDYLAAWVAWCQEHAPERLQGPKGGA